MPLEIRTIELGGVNCYLVHPPNGFILIDTGFANKRGFLVDSLSPREVRGEDRHAWR